MKTIHLLAAVTLAVPLTTSGQTAIFTDNFSSGNDTLNDASVPGGTPTASWTSFDIAASKAATTGPALASGDFTLKLNSATTSGFLEAQATFTGSPVTLATVGDYIDLTYTFTDTSGTLLAGGTSSYIFAGLYNSGGNLPTTGLNNTGLTTNNASPFATGNAANWKGFASRLSVGGASQIFTRPLQNGSGTTSANQDLIGNNFGAGAYNNPSGTLLTGGNGTNSTALTAGAQYTQDMRIFLTAAGLLTVTDELFSGAGTGGPLVFGQTNSASGVTLLTSTFDGLAIGARNSGTSFNPTMDISEIAVSDLIQQAPEPNAYLLLAAGGMLFGSRRLRKA